MGAEFVFHAIPRPRLVLAGLCALFLAAGAEPAAAHSAEPSPTLSLGVPLLVVVGVLFLAGEVAYLGWSHRKGAGETSGRPPAAQIAWVGAPMGLGLAVAALAFFRPASSPEPTRPPASSRAALVLHAQPPQGALVVEATARQFRWDFSYQVGGTEGAAGGHRLQSSTELHLPPDRDVHLRLESKDVIHSFDVPALGIRQDLTPGRPIVLSFRVTRPGRYEIVCSALCGSSSSQEMPGVIVVEEPGSFERWVARATSGYTNPNP